MTGIEWILIAITVASVVSLSARIVSLEESEAELRGQVEVLFQIHMDESEQKIKQEIAELNR